MYAKKFFSFSSKPFSYFTSSFSNFFSSLNIFTTESPEAEYTDNDQSSQNKDFNFYQIQTQSCQEFINSYEDWNGKKNFSHNMTERLPCKMILKGNSFLGNVLSFFSQRRNCLDNRIVSIQFAANNPIEDRIAIDQIQDVEGYLLNIFDGHGGWQLAEYAMENLPRKFKKYLSESHEMFLEIGFSLDQIILDCLLKTYDSIEKSFLKIARKAKSMGSLKTGTVGACVLSVFVHDNKLYVANSGDCKGFICSSTEKNMIKCRKINKKLNTSSLSERNRLKLAFPLDSDICKQKNSQNKSFYLKNILQPTRAFGDYCLKYTEFNEEKSGKFHGPYLSHQPDVQIIEINEMDKFLILGSDGVWDMVKRKVLEHILEKNSRNIYSISENIFNFVTEQICILKGIALHYKIENLFYSILGVDKEELMGMPLGSERRKYHDDISLMVVDLKNQFKQT